MRVDATLQKARDDALDYVISFSDDRSQKAQEEWPVIRAALLEAIATATSVGGGMTLQRPLPPQRQGVFGELQRA